MVVAPSQAFASGDKGDDTGGRLSRLETRAHYVEFVFKLSRFDNIHWADHMADLGFRRYKKPIDKRLDWSTDGCSVPVSHALKEYADKTFYNACVRHDFGYRNYGSDNKHGPHLDPTEHRRKEIDDRFLFEMRAICSHKHGASGTICRKKAALMYLGARKGAKSHFF
ncbi:hypothetical protein GCM10027613_14400 [Microlunatus endophyticus]